MVRVILNGCLGRMGQAVAASVQGRDDLRIVAGIDLAAPAGGGASAPPKPGAFPVYPSLADSTEEADVIIDFTSPDSVRGLLQAAAGRRLPVVLATTGFRRRTWPSSAAPPSRSPSSSRPTCRWGST